MDKQDAILHQIELMKEHADFLKSSIKHLHKLEDRRRRCFCQYPKAKKLNG